MVLPIGFTINEGCDHMVELLYDGTPIASFVQTAVTIDILRAVADLYLRGELEQPDLFEVGQEDLFERRN